MPLVCSESRRFPDRMRGSLLVDTLLVCLPQVPTRSATYDGLPAVERIGFPGLGHMDVSHPRICARPAVSINGKHTPSWTLGLGKVEGERCCSRQQRSACDSLCCRQPHLFPCCVDAYEPRCVQ
jgi:hypothetical protein